MMWGTNELADDPEECDSIAENLVNVAKSLAKDCARQVAWA